ncbi:MAG TPA: hypothetical protein VFE51_04995 [Verrucomicrobiae bacterium]|nr:hypothetical protein [Verrucomicrobiae bacterium]
MDDQPTNYHAEFFKSPHHAVLALLTLGVGFLSAQILGLIAGLTAFVLGWIYLPDLPFFRRWVDHRHNAAKEAGEAQKVAEFVQRRDALLRSLTAQRRERYGRLAQVCRDIETASADSPLTAPDANTDPRLRKLDELMWTYLRLLGIEQSLEQFLETERGENVPAVLQDAEAEVARLNTEVEALKAKGNDPTLETRQRYLGSRLERLEVLRKRVQRSQQAESNLALIVSEQDRLDQQIKLLRADAVATKNAESLTARIDATVEHLDQTNKWLSELDEFKDLVGDLPSTDQRVGYQASWQQAGSPPVIEPVQIRRQQPRQGQTR